MGGRWVRHPRGDLSVCLDWLPTLRGAGRGGQKSAEGIGAAAHGGEGKEHGRPEGGQLPPRTRGAPGVDGMTVEALSPYLKGEWPRIREELLGGTYVPSPVRQVTIPKPDWKGRGRLGIPTGLGRFIQQAVL